MALHYTIAYTTRTLDHELKVFGFIYCCACNTGTVDLFKNRKVNHYLEKNVKFFKCCIIAYNTQNKYVSTRNQTHHTYVFPSVECGFNLMNGN